MLAVTTRKPSSRNAIATSFVIRGSSSATRTRGCVLTVTSRVRTGRSTTSIVPDDGVGNQVEALGTRAIGPDAALTPRVSGDTEVTRTWRWMVRGAVRSIGSSLMWTPPGSLAPSRQAVGYGPLGSVGQRKDGLRARLGARRRSRMTLQRRCDPARNHHRTGQRADHGSAFPWTHGFQRSSLRASGRPACHADARP